MSQGEENYGRDQHQQEDIFEYHNDKGEVYVIDVADDSTDDDNGCSDSGIYALPIKIDVPIPPLNSLRSEKDGYAFKNGDSVEEGPTIVGIDSGGYYRHRAGVVYTKSRVISSFELPGGDDIRIIFRKRLGCSGKACADHKMIEITAENVKTYTPLCEWKGTIYPSVTIAENLKTSTPISEWETSCYAPILPTARQAGNNLHGRHSYFEMPHYGVNHYSRKIKSA
ncbi:hypothetical protein SNE40_022378 [Patella caerulea]|uniref:Uncharacterized protein n=1 Tax=Patella caerulea TaxID=87958 RepID=A0AAN8IVP6_PATCE